MSTATGDYGTAACAAARCDDAARALHDLATGQIGALFHDQPAMGLTSLVLRAPAVTVAHAFGGGLEAEYRAGTFVCLLAAALVGLWISDAIRPQRQRDWVAAVAILGLAIFWSRAAFFGHPEEPLAGSLSIAGVVLAARGRPVAAGVTLGLAIGTKEWALLALPVAAAASPRAEWLRIGTAAALAGAVLVLAPFIADPSAFRASHATRDPARFPNTPANVWYRMGHEQATQTSAGLAVHVFPDKTVARFARAAVFALTLIAAVLYARTRPARAPQVLALAAFAFALRVVLDTGTLSYYHVALLMALPVWEVADRRRFPYVALAATAAFQVTARLIAPNLSADSFNAFYVLWAVPLTAYLWRAALMPARARARPC